VATAAALLVLLAFVVVCLIASIVSFKRRQHVLAVDEQRIYSAAQLIGELHGLQTFDAAVAASQQARCARLLREERNGKILTSVAFGLSVLIAILALAALFLAGDHNTATVCAMMAAISLTFTTVAYLSSKYARKKATRSTRQMEQSP
jgi:VIT1/CCC1 family predicted Fe2+/Mn2+ transporter